jgi:hypothetical protein
MGLAQIRLDSGDVASVVADFLSQFDLLSPSDRAHAMQTMISDLPEMLYQIRNDAIVDMAKEGVSAEEIGDLLLISDAAVNMALSKVGYERQRKVPEAARIPLRHPRASQTP